MKKETCEASHSFFGMDTLPGICRSPATMAVNPDGSIKGVDELIAVEQWVYTKALKGSEDDRSVVALVLEDCWNDVTAEQLAVLKPVGSRFVPDLSFPHIYDNDFRRVEDARRLAGFGVDNKRFTMPQLGGKAIVMPPVPGRHSSGWKKSSNTLRPR